MPPGPPSRVLPARPLASTDDRGTFDCGRVALNTWFQRHAWHNHADDVSRVNVLCEAETGDIVGYVSLSCSQIERAFLPKSQQRNRPDPLPATLLGQLAVHQDHQGQGHAGSLLYFALKTALQASKIVGSIGMITHPTDEGVRAFYGKFGFQDLPFDPRRAMIVRMVDIEKSGFGA